jgi:hypothetical protein
VNSSVTASGACLTIPLPLPGEKTGEQTGEVLGEPPAALLARPVAPVERHVLPEGKGLRHPRLLNLAGINFPLAGAVNVGYAGSGAQCWWETCDFLALPFFDDQADQVLLHRVLSLYPQDLAPNLLAEALRVAKVGAELLVIELDLWRVATRYAVGLVDCAEANDRLLYPDAARRSAWDEPLLRAMGQRLDAPTSTESMGAGPKRLEYRGRLSEPELAARGWIELDRDDSLILQYRVGERR